MSNYAFEGPAWSSSTVTWSFAAQGGDITGAITGAYQNTVRAAIARWAQVVNLTLQEVPTGTAGVDVKIGWGQFAGTQVGETDYSYQGGASQTFSPGTEVRLEDPSARPIGTGMSDYYQGTATTLYETALHEFGHSLGLAHSTDPAAVMFASVGPSDNGLGASDIQGIQVLYGARASSVAQSSAPAPATPTVPAAITLSGDTEAVYRFFDNSNGTQFLTADLSERNAVIATRPDLTYEGLGMGALTSASGHPTAVVVYRFFDTHNGSHFFTSSQSEETQLLATRPDLSLEQATFFEDATQQAGDLPVYRFFDSSTGTHFFTESNAERLTLQSTRPDMISEGIAFYAPSSGLAKAMFDAADATASPTPTTISISDDTLVVYRFASANGAQLLTADTGERDTILATQPTYAYQGVGLGSVSPAAGDPDAAPVYRLFDASTGDHFLTASATEAQQLAVSRPDMVSEQVAFYEHTTQQAGDVAVYRFFDAANGTHTYTASASERASISATPGMVQEGIAFYAPSIS